MKTITVALLVLLLAVPTMAGDSLHHMINSVRMILLDRGAPVAFEDSVYSHHGRLAIYLVGVQSLAVVVDTTFPLTSGTLLYALDRRPLRMVTAYRSFGGAKSNVPRVPHGEMWKKDINESEAYSIGPGMNVFITDELSNEDSLHLHYATEPNALPSDSITVIDLPDGLLPALYYQTAASILEATRLPPNLQAAAGYSAQAKALIQVYLFAIQGAQPDTAAFPR